MSSSNAVKVEEEFGESHVMPVMPAERKLGSSRQQQQPQHDAVRQNDQAQTPARSARPAQSTDTTSTGMPMSDLRRAFRRGINLKEDNSVMGRIKSVLAILTSYVAAQGFPVGNTAIVEPANKRANGYITLHAVQLVEDPACSVTNYVLSMSAYKCFSKFTDATFKTRMSQMYWLLANQSAAEIAKLVKNSTGFADVPGGARQLLFDLQNAHNPTDPRVKPSLDLLDATVSDIGAILIDMVLDGPDYTDDDCRLTLAGIMCLECRRIFSSSNSSTASSSGRTHRLTVR